ncbi:N-6 DNA methylase [Pedobacter sp. LMG 31464]|uniref:site-specific DNA-methyltransferase (adenine-specific) n=1 Tax=Pedobacter planticolens TaxID=2679964 RepID=A0A923IUV8_9SPHI|nr:type ISP restriction/modification enzyme [Pedobacter planticolens]MBB2145168.1 N-6 DNA methylase [Pedobacter planticolens]
MTIQTYLSTLQLRYQTGISREHTYRGDLQTLLMAMLPDILVTNEPARVACGAPDYMLTRKDIPVGYIEAKDIGVDLHSKTLKEQFDRYRSGLSNLIFTDYLDFHFYKDGVFTTSIAIARLQFPSTGGVSEGQGGQIVPLPENFDTFQNLIKNFAETISQTIKSPTKLAEMMAGKAKLMADVIEKTLNHDDETETKTSLKQQMLSFKQMLIHDINNSAFADIYAQTIAYGMFAARYHDPTLPTFSRQEAATLIPKSNPFLRKLFQDIAGYDLDDRLVWMVDELVNIFLATDVADIMKNFGKSTKQEDPVVHFYETFLATYNPALRKARGVWYTPQPVVNFIVRAVDDILKTEFNLPQGLADTSKIKVKTKHVTKATADQRSKLKEVETEHEVHKVQILDPATGTGTFLAEVVKHIHKKFEGQQGIWSNYVNQHLIPRLNGFELLMASYAMAHLKMDMLLTETGYKATTDQRFRIFLTNSLEEAHPDTGTLFSSWLSDEADQANAIKRDAPVMVVMGNPPYSGESANKSEWIMNLMEDYKKEPGGKEKLKERNPKWINDDYVKFIRFGQHFIEKNGTGILAFINPHGFLDNPTFRGMRWNLLKTYDKIYTIDLHGNSKKKETALDGSLDQNVFDIMQGVSINLFIKTGKKTATELGEVFHFDLFGKRDFKYNFLSENNLNAILFKRLVPNPPSYILTQTDFGMQSDYEIGFKIDDLYPVNGTGIVSKRDSLAFKENVDEIKDVINNIFHLSISEIKQKYDKVGWESRDGKAEFVKENVMEFGTSENFFIKCDYRLFDKKWTYYTGKSKGFIGWPVNHVMKNYILGDNVGLCCCKQFKAGNNYHHVFISNTITESSYVSNKTSEITSNFPLYIYPEQTNQTTLDGKIERVPNLNMEIVNKIAESAGYYFAPEEPNDDCMVETMQFYPINILDYIYAVLHSPAYRDKYKEFLKIDFPRVPYPTFKNFMPLANLGSQLRKLHLLESEDTEKYITQYPIDGSNEVIKPHYVCHPESVCHPELVEGKTNHEPNSPLSEGCLKGGVFGKVYINETQCFNNVPEIAWNFYIGGYQPAQKWLKDRKGRVLEFDDILHYQKIIVALTKTSELIMEIDQVMEV